MSATVATNDEGQVEIRFKTKQLQYAVQSAPYVIDAKLSTIDLNTIVNGLLKESSIEVYKGKVEFDFIVSDEYLRGRLCDHLRDKAISIEDTVEIEYVERFPAPEPEDCLLHDDWVSAVATCRKWILTGCYDNTVNIWTTKGKHIKTISGHTMPIKALAWISVDEERAKFISCAQDQLAMVWEWIIETNLVECISVCKGHERGIDSVAVSPDKKRFATGSWDTMLKLWSAETLDAGEGVSKRIRPDIGSTKTPLFTLQGHRECISGVEWMDSNTLLTSSWDHTIKIWDLNLEGIKSEISTNKSIFDVSYSQLNNLIVTASADKNIRLYDARTNFGSVVRNTYLGHSQWVQTVMWSATEEHLFVSGSYDNQNKLWDCRSPKAPLYDLIGHSDKVLDIDWSNPQYIVSGGADNSVRIFKTRKGLQTDKNDKI